MKSSLQVSSPLVKKKAKTGRKMELDLVLGIVFPVALAVIMTFLVCPYTRGWLRWIKVRKALQRQDIKGPRPSFLMGNLPEMQKIQLQAAMRISNQGSNFGTISHDYTSTLFPYFEHWRKEYGPIYTYSTGMRQHLYMNKLDLVKELNQSISLSLGKPSYVTKRLAPILGSGILRSNGLTWANQRKIVAPEFYMDKVKGMMGIMSDLAQSLLRKWGDAIEAQGGTAIEIKVDEELRTISADVISRTCFGASSHKGKEIFTKLRSLQKIMSQQSFLFGLNLGSLSFRQRSQISCLEREIESMIWNAVKEREKGCCSPNSCPSEYDLMQLMMEAASQDQSLSKLSSKRFIVDNCKNIYFAGHESTAVAASWCLMLLALHPEWQTRLRAEVAQVWPDGLPNTNSITQLKVVTMVILEALRLYPPAAFVSREALEETQIGNIVIPKGVCLWTLIPTLHRDPDNWGPDASEFKPERFANGVSKACKSPQAYIPFGMGPRLCLGRNFAMVQLKVLLSLIVSKFSFSLSPNYQHSPSYRMIVEPGHGVNILIKKSS